MASTSESQQHEHGQRTMAAAQQLVGALFFSSTLSVQQHPGVGVIAFIDAVTAAQ